jgi:hypothetical protein
VQGTFSWSVADEAGSSQGPSGTTTSPANPLQSLASDIQAMLIQAQSAAATSGAAASGTATSGAASAAATPEQSVTSDLQTLLGDIQSAISPNTQTANTNPASPTGQTAPHHHHHHHGGDGEANGASDVAAAAPSPGPAASNTGSVLASDQTVSSIFATDIAQAIHAYGGDSASTSQPALTV